MDFALKTKEKSFHNFFFFRWENFIKLLVKTFSLLVSVRVFRKECYRLHLVLRISTFLFVSNGHVPSSSTLISLLRSFILFNSQYWFFYVVLVSIHCPVSFCYIWHTTYKKISKDENSHRFYSVKYFYFWLILLSHFFFINTFF